MKLHMLKILSLFIVGASLSACGPGLQSPGSVTVEPTGRNSSSDPCLEGYWVMSNEDVNALMSSLVTVPGLSIPLGTLEMAFIEGEWSYGSNELLVRMDVPGGYMEADAAFLFTGKFTSSEGSITFNNIIYDAEAFSWRAYINGEMMEVEGPSALAFPVPGNGPYNCSGDSLSFDTTSGTGSVVGLFFTRQP